jgi:cytochrome c5
MSDQHQSFIKTPQQLVVVVVLAFVVPIAIIAALASLVTSGAKGDGGSEKDVLMRIAPVGRVEIGTGVAVAPPAPVAAAPAAADGKVDGKAVYDSACMACHTTGIAGSPKLGDKAAWAPRIAQGNNTLYEHAIKGFQGKAGLMPAKGGNTALSDAQVRAAVDYMVGASK